MSVLKWNVGGKWIAFYEQAIKNRLRVDKNLSDIPDKAEARKNLEIVGDVSTHHHDSRYQPKIDAALSASKAYTDQKIQEEHDARIVETSTLSAGLYQEKNDRIKKDEELQSQIDSINSWKNSFTVFDSQGRLVFPNGNLLWIE